MQSDQLHVPADFSHIMLRDGSWLTREPPCRFLQLGLFHVRLSQSVLLHFLTFSQHSERAWGFPSNTFSNFFRWLSCFLHVRYIPLHNSRWPFWASVILMSARKGDMSPSGNTCLGNNLNFLPDLWVQTFYGSTLSTESATVGLFSLLTLLVAVLNSVPLCLASPSSAIDDTLLDVKFFLFILLERQTAVNCILHSLRGEVQDMPSGMVIFSLYGLWWGWIVYLSHRIRQLSMGLWFDRGGPRAFSRNLHDMLWIYPFIN